MFEGQTERPQPATIEEAWRTLTPQAFGLWIRLMTIPGWELKQGRTRIIELVEKHRLYVHKYLGELRDKGYIRLVASPGKATEIVIVLAPVILTPNHFINFG